MHYLFGFALFSCYCLSVMTSEVITAPNDTDLYICEASQGVGSDLSFVGKYTVSQEEHDGVHVYTSENDMSFFRNMGFW